MNNTFALSALFKGNGIVRNVLFAVAGSFLVAIAAQVTIPVPVIPLTLQTLAVLIIGAAFGARLGAATLALYVVEAAVGLPVLAYKTSGLSVIAGPSGGYIIGFIPAAALVGYLVERNRDRNVVKMFIAALLGAAVIYIPGLLWLHHFANGWVQTLEWGLVPFVVGDLIKAALFTVGFQAAWTLLGRQV